MSTSSIICLMDDPGSTLVWNGHKDDMGRMCFVQSNHSHHLQQYNHHLYYDQGCQDQWTQKILLFKNLPNCQSLFHMKALQQHHRFALSPHGTHHPLTYMKCSNFLNEHKRYSLVLNSCW